MKVDLITANVVEQGTASIGVFGVFEMLARCCSQLAVAVVKQR
jgi:hypothetical protein